MNWHEDKFFFWILCKGQSNANTTAKSDSKMHKVHFTPKKHALRIRTFRFSVILTWVLFDIIYTIYLKVFQCREAASEIDYNRLCWVKHISFSSHFFGFIGGLLLGLTLFEIRSRKNKNFRKILKSLAIVVFLTIFCTALVLNFKIYQEESQKDRTNCTLTGFMKKCQAKCYCKYNNKTLLENTFPNCLGFEICKYCNQSKTCNNYWDNNECKKLTDVDSELYF